MSKFKVGDKVRVKSIPIGDYGYERDYTGCIGYIMNNECMYLSEGLECSVIIGNTPVGLRYGNLELVESINNNENKIMSVIKKAFQSKESKAVVDLGLGENSHNLNDKGLIEFVSFMFETNVELRDSFLAKLVEVNNEKNK